VSRTLSCLTPQETENIISVLARISQPFFDKEAVLALRQEGRLILDGDLSGRPVSDTSHTYPEVAFGHMDDQVHLGYQAALVSIQSPTYGRLWLSVSQHPGDTVSCTEAEPMIRRSEAILGLRPTRRLDLLRKRLEIQESRQNGLKEALENANLSLEEAHHGLDEVVQQVAHWEQCAHETETTYQEKQRSVRPHSLLAQSRNKLACYQRRQKRREAMLSQAERRLKRQQKNGKLGKVKRAFCANVWIILKRITRPTLLPFKPFFVWMLVLARLKTWLY